MVRDVKCIHLDDGFVLRLNQHRALLKQIHSLVEYVKKRDYSNQEYKDEMTAFHERLFLNFWPGPTAHHNIVLDPTSAGRPCRFNAFRFKKMLGE